MVLTFPEDFQFGTSTASTQIETAFEHDWQNHVARDGHVFYRTTDHELRREEDAEIISSIAPYYRMNFMWSKLQRSPMQDFHPETEGEYMHLVKMLRNNGTKIMLVLHHFANPLWFANLGGWERTENISLWVDFAKRIVDKFGEHVSSWNTFNEPNLYTSLGWVASEFPPHKKNILLAYKVINNIAKAHDIVYNYIKSRFPLSLVGISHNCTIFQPHNVAGVLPAKLLDYLFMEYAPSRFKKIDFFGMSYYARITFDPFPITFLETPEKIERLGKPHDDMWEYFPEGLGHCIRRYWSKYRKPVIITENGVCTHDDTLRVKAIRDYLRVVHRCIQEGVDVRGYYHWSTWDNFEWSLGPSYRFGLYSCDLQTMERTKKPSANLYAQVAFSKKLLLS